MSQQRDLLKRELDELRRVRDELRLQAHLGGMEARDLWDDLEERFDGAEARAKRLAHAPQDALDELGDSVAETLAELRDGYARLRARLATEARAESVWDRMRHTVERVVDESYRATERVVDSIEEFGDTARLRVERARLERDLLRKCTELGTRVYQLAQEAGLPDGTPPQVLDDDEVQALLGAVATMDAQMRKIESELDKEKA